MKILKKILIVAGLMLLVLTCDSFAQKPRRISEMIADSEKSGGLLSGLLGGDAGSGNLETTVLSAVTFPNKVRVKYLGETRKISKKRKKNVDRWLAEYAKTPDAKKFYVNELAVDEDGARYWVIAHESAVVEKLKTAAKSGDEIVLQLRVLGYSKKGAATDYFLLAESLD
ncbi:MAG: hypothetical protein JSS81_16720 [Acidobacteria bacterium]|nr:hypothetical protein [Acidobacteriota bacterium]